MGAPPGPAVATASPLEAIQSALAHTQRYLFPFRFQRWLAFGFLAFLDQCGRRAGLGFNVPSGPGDLGDASEGLEWLAAHAVLVMLVAGFVLALVVVTAALVLWVNSRGVFMYVDAVVTGRTEIGRPWNAHAERASSYFAWSFGLAMAGLLGVLLVLAAGAAIAITFLRGGGPHWPGVVALVLAVLGLLAILMAASLASLALRDFVAPLQLATGLPCSGAVRLLLNLLRAHTGAFVLYVLLKIAFSVVLGMAMLVAACLTCCCALLPVVSQTLFQPAFHFERAWSLYLLRQMGYDVLGPFAVPGPAEGPAPASP